MRLLFCIILLLCCSSWYSAQAQDSARRKLMGTSLFDTARAKPHDTLVKKPVAPMMAKTAQDTPVIVKRRIHDPNKATVRSAMIPGWGQIYNREYWKLPLVYGALAIPTATFIFNNTYYKRAKYAYEAVYAATTEIDGKVDKSKLPGIHPSMLKENGETYPASSYQNIRNSYRQARDYSVLWFLIVWGINVVDATVFGHLKTFDVSDDLSLQVSPTFNSALRTPGVGLVLTYKKATPRYSLSALR
ncbi:DUF5683 domain-containing protein [Filimonas effusa]|uniref:DUF5683 domain-containing protein n=1 Tax=Filimonas effusa TaxID=2508721 RepID=A0A4Q1D7Z8_9BACT|nr:DUF5683 domain-containing protein [Filimonas effusa]RXK85371.1 hypothetical protein ESB13_00670 [Filimonas effusa]